MLDCAPVCREEETGISSESRRRLSAGASAGIVIGCIVATAAAILTCVGVWHAAPFPVDCSFDHNPMNDDRDCRHAVPSHSDRCRVLDWPGNTCCPRHSLYRHTCVTLLDYCRRLWSETSCAVCNRRCITVPSIVASKNQKERYVLSNHRIQIERLDSHICSLLFMHAYR